MKINHRPGRGGQHRRTTGAIDQSVGLARFGEVTWTSVAGGARVGVIELASSGNAVILCRLSSEEENDRFVDQLQPCVALARQHGLEARTAIIAESMSGAREVRPGLIWSPELGPAL